MLYLLRIQANPLSSPLCAVKKGNDGWGGGRGGGGGWGGGVRNYEEIHTILVCINVLFN